MASTDKGYFIFLTCLSSSRILCCLHLNRKEMVSYAICFFRANIICTSYIEVTINISGQHQSCSTTTTGPIDSFHLSFKQFCILREKDELSSIISDLEGIYF